MINLETYIKNNYNKNSGFVVERRSSSTTSSSAVRSIYNPNDQYRGRGKNYKQQARDYAEAWEEYENSRDDPKPSPKYPLTDSDFDDCCEVPRDRWEEGYLTAKEDLKRKEEAYDKAFENSIYKDTNKDAWRDWKKDVMGYSEEDFDIEEQTSNIKNKNKELEKLAFDGDGKFIIRKYENKGTFSQFLTRSHLTKVYLGKIEHYNGKTGTKTFLKPLPTNISSHFREEYFYHDIPIHQRMDISFYMTDGIYSTKNDEDETYLVVQRDNIEREIIVLHYPEENELHQVIRLSYDSFISLINDIEELTFEEQGY